MPEIMKIETPVWGMICALVRAILWLWICDQKASAVVYCHVIMVKVTTTEASEVYADFTHFER